MSLLICWKGVKNVKIVEINLIKKMEVSRDTAACVHNIPMYDVYDFYISNI